MANNICSMCGGASTQQPNFQKQVDPPIRPYGTILGDEPESDGYSGGSGRSGRGGYPGGGHHGKGGCQGNVTAPVQICLPTLACPPPMPTQGRHNPGQQPTIVQVPKDPVRPCPRIICDPCPPPPPTRVWLIKSSPVPQKVGLRQLLLFLLSFAIAQPPACIPLGNDPIVIPCQRPC